MNSTKINRREFLQRSTLLTSSVLLGLAEPASGAESAAPLDIGAGPQLFLDDFVIATREGLKREVQSPQRFGPPVLDSKSFGTTQPYLTVLRDGKNGFRAFYNNGSAIWHAESVDGIHWANPKSVLETSHCYGASVVDDGERAGDPQRRFKMATWQATHANEGKPGDDSGMWVGFSPDGFHWSGCDSNPVLPTWPEGFGKYVRHAAQDVVDAFFDPLQRRYAVALKIPAVAADGYAPGPRAGQSFRRLVGMSTSKDFVNWERPWRILVPDDSDDGLLEFYGMGGIHLRGGLRIGLVRVLRDDLPCDPGGPKNGIGYTVLATSRDGIHWERFREPFLDRNLEPGSWDHAMTWMSHAVPMGDEMFFYYGGYARGHKIEPKTERQIGLARMKKDRYVALTSRDTGGKLLTKPFICSGDRLTLNANASRGEVRVRLLARDSKPLKTLGNPDSNPITGDVLAKEIHWQKSLHAVHDRPIRLEFTLRNAALFGFEVHSA